MAKAGASLIIVLKKKNGAVLYALKQGNDMLGGKRMYIARKVGEKAFKKWFPKNDLLHEFHPMTAEETKRFKGIYRKTKVPCSCWMCKNPRRIKGSKKDRLTVQELRQLQKEKYNAD